jgi:hypothetical protein
MKYLQLFREIPPDSLMTEVLSCYNLLGILDTQEFSKKNLEDLHTVEKMTSLVPKLTKYYVPCKAKTYLTDITLKKCITILSQLLRIHGFYLRRKERFLNRKKTIVYTIRKKGEKDISFYNITELSFD